MKVISDYGMDKIQNGSILRTVFVITEIMEIIVIGSMKFKQKMVKSYG